MKRAIALFIVFAFVMVLAAVVHARTTAEEYLAVQNYLSVLDEKINRYRTAGNKAMVDKLHAEKKATIERLKVLKSQLQMEEMAPPPPPPARPAPAPAPAPVAKKGNGLFGWGNMVDVGGQVGLIAGVAGANIEARMADPLKVGQWMGLPASDLKIGAIYTQGDGKVNHNTQTVKVGTIYIDGVLNLPPAWMGGIDNYVGGGLNYVLTRSGNKSGTIGGEIYYGLQGDPLGLGTGVTFGELGMHIIRPGTDENPADSFKSVTLTVGWRVGL